MIFNFDILIHNGEAVGELMKKFVIEELEQQGHIIDIPTPGFPESFKDSLEIKISETADSINIELWGNEYWIGFDQGVSSGNVNYDPLQMIEWAAIIKPEYDQARLVKYMVKLHEIQQKEGVPINAAYNPEYTKNGRRKSFTQYALVEKEDNFFDAINFMEFFQYTADYIANLLTSSVKR